DILRCSAAVRPGRPPSGVDATRRSPERSFLLPSPRIRPRQRRVERHGRAGRRRGGAERSRGRAALRAAEERGHPLHLPPDQPGGRGLRRDPWRWSAGGPRPDGRARVRPHGAESGRLGPCAVSKARGLAAAVAVLVVAAPSGSAAPGSAPGLIDRQPCPELSGFTCSTLVVPLDHDGGRPGTLRLRVAAANNVAAPRGVLLFLAGGPGQPGVPYLGRIAGALAAVRSDYRLVVYDERGTGDGAL